MTAQPFLGPDVRDLGAAYIDPSARLFGDVEIGPEASLWCNVVVRAESDRVVIGPRTNIQDFVMIHVGAGTGTMIGADCSITHHVTRASVASNSRNKRRSQSRAPKASATSCLSKYPAMNSSSASAEND